MKSQKESGFTAVELLITLFVAAAFLIAAYQLFNLVIRDGGATRAESRAANVGYDYMRQYAASSTTIPCTASSPLNDAPVTVDGLVNVTVDVNITCLPDAIESLSKVEVSVTYNSPAQTLTYATYTSSSGISGDSKDITNGLAAWWKLNGDATTSVGTPNGNIANVTSVPNQSGQADSAYSFNGTNSSISAASNYGMSVKNATISCWIYNPTATNNGAFVKVGSAGYGIGIGTTNFETAGTPGSKLIMLLEGVRWIVTGASVGTGWHHVVMVLDSNGIPSAYLDGVSVGSYTGTVATSMGSATTTIGSGTNTTRNFTGYVDDVRLYSRALPLADILTIYSGGAK